VLGRTPPSEGRQGHSRSQVWLYAIALRRDVGRCGVSRFLDDVVLAYPWLIKSGRIIGIRSVTLAKQFQMHPRRECCQSLCWKTRSGSNQGQGSASASSSGTSASNESASSTSANTRELSPAEKPRRASAPPIRRYLTWRSSPDIPRNFFSAS